MSPIKRFTDFKLRMSQCRLFSSETALLTAVGEEEYNVTFSKESGHIHVKYPLKKDLGILINNGKEAK